MGSDYHCLPEVFQRTFSVSFAVQIHRFFVEVLCLYWHALCIGVCIHHCSPQISHTLTKKVEMHTNTFINIKRYARSICHALLDTDILMVARGYTWYIDQLKPDVIMCRLLSGSIQISCSRYQSPCPIPIPYDLCTPIKYQG